MIQGQHHHLRLIAIVPPDPLFTTIRKEQEYIAETWGPLHALRTPPHITIIPPMALSSAETGFLYGMAEAIAGSVTPFDILLQGYGAFKPRVIFIEPAKADGLQLLHDIWRQALMTRMPHVLEKYPDRPFHPHVTLAHKDVKGSQFAKAYEHYAKQTFHASFTADHFHILQHAEEGWIIEKGYRLG